MASARQHDSAGGWALALAARLRLIHAGFVDEEASQRKAFLADEIERATASIPPSRRDEYLQALGDQFPAWQAVTGQSSAADAPAEPTAAELVTRLLTQLDQLTPDELGRLKTALTTSTGLEFEVDPAYCAEVWQRLGVPSSAVPSGQRTWKLLAGLLEFFLALDQVGWALWRNLRVKSAFTKESDLVRQAGPYLVGDDEVSTEQTRQTMERTRRLLAALVGASGRAAADVAGQHGRNFSPESIEQAARSDKRALESLDAACWREYKQRYATNGAPPYLEAAIQQAVAQAAEDLIGGRTR